MLFKSMGLDPSAMQKSAAEFKGAVIAINNGINDVKEQNAEILKLLREVKAQTTPVETVKADG